MEVENKDGTKTKALFSEVYPYGNFVEQYPGSTIKTCMRPLEHPEVQPVVLLEFIPRPGQVAPPAAWYKEKLEKDGWKVEGVQFAGTTMIRATKNDDVLGISVFGYDSGVIDMRAAKKGESLPTNGSDQKTEQSLSHSGRSDTSSSDAVVDVDQVAEQVAAAVKENGLYENATLNVMRKQLVAGNRLANHKDEIRNSLQSKFDQQGGRYKAATSNDFDLKIFEDSDPSAVYIKGKKLEVRPKD